MIHGVIESLIFQVTDRNLFYETVIVDDASIYGTNIIAKEISTRSQVSV